MKKKDLNTFIQDKLDAENGIPFKDEYWNSMNDLLDANMPVSHAAAGAAKTTSILKLVFISVASVMLITVSVLSYSYFNSKITSPKTSQVASLSPTVNSENKTTPINSTLVQTERQHELTTPLQTTTKTEATVSQNSSNTKQTTNILAATDISNNKISSLNNTRKTNKKNAEPSPFESEYSYTESSNSFEVLPEETMPSSTEIEEFSHTQSEFNVIDSHLPNFTLQTPALALLPISTPINPTRNSVFKHLNVSAFIGAIRQEQGKTIESYTLPAQTNFTYGISVESTIKRISFRTGFAISNSTINLTTQYLNTVYTVDTTYKIVNPNYGTTPSGKPIALVQKHLDTTSVTTTSYAKESSYQYQILSIPTTLHYKIPLNRFTLILEGGALHHIRVAQQSNAPIQVSNAEIKTTFPTYSMQVCAGGGIRYALNINWAIGVNYMYSLNPNQTSLHLVNNAQQASFALTRYLW
ncbi:MAG: hypothetical protein CFE21_15375 [Bacteroidetes bacterium B1(2017)]|nr:MAG: hypothetical protein CFE21_15375 [Bacteroidetes bacterium B1(2017)]